MITFTCESDLRLLGHQTWGDPPWLPVLGLLLREEVPYDTPPTPRALLACCLPNLFAVRHWG